eukprot:1858465-Amphidinium_carterae.1
MVEGQWRTVRAKDKRHCFLISCCVVTVPYKCLQDLPFPMYSGLHAKKFVRLEAERRPESR